MLLCIDFININCQEKFNQKTPKVRQFYIYLTSSITLVKARDPGWRLLATFQVV
jgi:hypothetical protein